MADRFLCLLVILISSRPVSRKAAPDYRLVVKKPMDLETIRVKLDGLKTYTSNQQVMSSDNRFDALNFFNTDKCKQQCSINPSSEK